jgi:hypothetical protein
LSEFAHRLLLDQIRDGDRLDIVADEAECGAVADRLALLSLDRLEAHAVLSRDGQKVRVKGRLRASLEQACVATGDPCPAHRRAVRPSVPARQCGEADEEIELGGADLDTVFHDGSAIDLGARSPTRLALALDPIRAVRGGCALKEAGVLTEEEAARSRLAALASAEVAPLKADALFWRVWAASKWNIIIESVSNAAGCGPLLGFRRPIRRRSPSP